MTKRHIGVIGTGDYARALSKRFLFNGFSVTCGSRNPQENKLTRVDAELKSVKVTTIANCIKESDTIILAIPVEGHSSIKQYEPLLNNKTLIDISNPIEPDDNNNSSIAENLAQILPNVKVVKAFNTLSAYGLEVDGNITTGNRDVMVASDDTEAKNTFMKMVRDLGFTAVDYGGLKMSRQLEKIPIILFNGWGLATKVVLIMLPVWLILGYLRYYVLKSPPFTVDRFSINFMNKIMGCMAITLLCACFIPGCLAAYIQIQNGTKYQRFSSWLDEWMKMRKQLGIYGLLFACLHVCMSMTVMTPAYFPDWFIKNPDAPAVFLKNIKGENVIFFGLTAFLLLCILGLTSVPAIGNLLNWREWVFVQSQLGIVCVLLATIHVTIKGFAEWQASKDWFEVVQRLSFQSILIPYFTLILKSVLLIPPVNAYVWKIRRGWERNCENNGKKSD